MISPVLPSLLISADAAAGGAVHAELMSATWGDALSCRTMSSPTARAARTRDAGVGGDRDNDPHVALAELLGEQPSRAPRLATWILKAAGGQALRDRNAKDAGADHDQQCDRNHPSRRRDGESSDSS